MGDLDNFFAKKDKKKKGTKGYCKANTDIIAKNLQELERKEQKQQQKEFNGDNINAEIINNNISKEEDEEEWAEYREKLKDYSVLKIESVRLVDSLDAEDTLQAEKKETEEKKDAEKGDHIELDDQDKEDTSEDETSEHKQRSEENNSNQVPNSVENKSSYVPPHMRDVRDVPKKVPTRKSKTAPDIRSEIYFPSLCNAVEDDGHPVEDALEHNQTEAHPKGAWGKKLAI